MEKIQKFLDAWTEDALNLKPVFISYLQYLSENENAVIEFHERPGISYSLRGIHKNRKEYPLFVMIDIIDDDPAERWLSVCFYEEMIKDPDELGDLIPEGLLGADGYCFDIDEPDEKIVSYVSRRIKEACTY